jgi:hypothetical protein
MTITYLRKHRVNSCFTFKLFASSAVRADDEIGVAGLLKRGIIYSQTSDRQMINHICEWLNGSSGKYLRIF